MGFVKAIIRTFVFTLLSILGFFTSNAQNPKKIDWDKYFSNDSVKYHILLVSPSALSKHGPATMRYVVSINMTDKVRKYLLKKDTAFWQAHLADSRTDWGTNIVLYDLYSENAFFFIDNKTREQWLHMKGMDVAMWRKLFLLMKKR